MRWLLCMVALVPSIASADPAPHEFIDDAKALLVVGACGDGTAPVKPEVYQAHCKKVRAAQDTYKTKWLAAADTFFRANVPANVPKTVVYPFAGGDLATALTV